MPSQLPLPHPISSLDTPSMLISLPALESNITSLFSLLAASQSPNTKNKISVRPHLKTTKSPHIAHRLTRAGARGFCVAKVSEAEVMLDAGVTDLLITTEVVGEVKVARVVELVRRVEGINLARARARARAQAQKDGEEEGEEGDGDGEGEARICCVVDCPAGADALNHALALASPSPQSTPLTLDILLDINTGTHRTGLPPGLPTLHLAQHILTQTPHLHIRGIQGYEGHAQHIHPASARRAACEESLALLTGTARLLRGEGVDVGVVSCGGTGTVRVCAEWVDGVDGVTGVTEVQPGSFVGMDADYLDVVWGGGAWNAEEEGDGKGDGKGGKGNEGDGKEEGKGDGKEEKEKEKEEENGKFKPALWILSTVISGPWDVDVDDNDDQHPETGQKQPPNRPRPRRRRAVIDAGLKSLTTDSGPARVWQRPGVTYEPLGDEHGGLTWDADSDPQGGFAWGERVLLVPSHIDPTVNLHDVFYACRDGLVEEVWPVVGRGMVQ
ncbi:hypothetical protein EJ05DRAFT_536033 [Pseudovirgaria hyperparasitica]|uniref:D-serine dehydratase-like domain-containing protein n=1 Tax=Pseudovirgaria hyperparasitica TaxID=470096 RepID=A0A6A6WGW4_9PEZI|nr:uncharacterized protein EJ05DRAFT_536033 [Pseudovirgaria hyperparasitica]KAF2761216.1 hypothetical protein EJ05DRAFT_536033 [Pseudovirgaria hyperparasitica]